VIRAGQALMMPVALLDRIDCGFTAVPVTAFAPIRPMA
jgi:hypothetical protein